MANSYYLIIIIIIIILIMITIPMNRSFRSNVSNISRETTYLKLLSKEKTFDVRNEISEQIMTVHFSVISSAV